MAFRQYIIICPSKLHEILHSSSEITACRHYYIQPHKQYVVCTVDHFSCLYSASSQGYTLTPAVKNDNSILSLTTNILYVEKFFFFYKQYMWLNNDKG